MLHLEQIKAILQQTLGLPGMELQAHTMLLGSIPELDSMAVLSVLTAIEEHFGIVIDDDDISARHFATVGSLTSFVAAKLAP